MFGFLWWTDNDSMPIWLGLTSANKFVPSFLLLLLGGERGRELACKVRGPEGIQIRHKDVTHVTSRKGNWLEEALKCNQPGKVLQQWSHERGVNAISMNGDSKDKNRRDQPRMYERIKGRPPAAWT